MTMRTMTSSNFSEIFLYPVSLFYPVLAVPILSMTSNKRVVSLYKLCGKMYIYFEGTARSFDMFVMKQKGEKLPRRWLSHLTECVLWRCSNTIQILNVMLMVKIGKILSCWSPDLSRFHTEAKYLTVVWAHCNLDERDELTWHGLIIPMEICT